MQTELCQLTQPTWLLTARIRNASAKGLIPSLEDILEQHNLPDISFLLGSRVKPAPWKKSIKKQLNIKTYLKFLTDCEDYYISGCDLKLGRPLQHWTVTLGDTQLNHANNLESVCLLGAMAVADPDMVPWVPWNPCLLYTSPSPRDATLSRMPSSA